jgi:hypothetical protein
MQGLGNADGEVQPENDPAIPGDRTERSAHDGQGDRTGPRRLFTFERPLY